MTDLLLSLYIGPHPGRGSYAPDDCRLFGKSLQDQQYQMNEIGRHPVNIITEEIYGD